MKSHSRRLRDCFRRLQKSNEAALIPFLMAGDPDLATTEEMALAMVDEGADILEIGVPFSDPMADGPVLQRAAERSLAGGTNLTAVLDLVSRLRAKTEIPIVLFGYANPFLQFGAEALASALAAAGGDAILCVDAPVDEADQLRIPLAENGLDMIFLLAPTSTKDRIRRVLKSASGVVYFVSVAGVTGDKQVQADPIAALDAAEPKAAQAVKAEDFEAAMAALASLRAPIDRFFDDVTVNDADAVKRTARLALLARVRAAVHTVADFSRIEG